MRALVFGIFFGLIVFVIGTGCLFFMLSFFENNPRPGGALLFGSMLGAIPGFFIGLCVGGILAIAERLVAQPSSIQIKLFGMASGAIAGALYWNWIDFGFPGGARRSIPILLYFLLGGVVVGLLTSNYHRRPRSPNGG